MSPLRRRRARCRTRGISCVLDDDPQTQRLGELKQALDRQGAEARLEFGEAVCAQTYSQGELALSQLAGLAGGLDEADMPQEEEAQTWAANIYRRRKNRTNSADASGPFASVYEPFELPPDHACEPPWTVHVSTIA